MDDSKQTLIIEVEGPEDQIQELLEKWEKEVADKDNLKMKAVTIRMD